MYSYEIYCLPIFPPFLSILAFTFFISFSEVFLVTTNDRLQLERVSQYDKKGRKNKVFQRFVRNNVFVKKLVL